MYSINTYCTISVPLMTDPLVLVQSISPDTGLAKWHSLPKIHRYWKTMLCLKYVYYSMLCLCIFFWGSMVSYCFWRYISSKEELLLNHCLFHAQRAGKATEKRCQNTNNQRSRVVGIVWKSFSGCASELMGPLMANLADCHFLKSWDVAVKMVCLNASLNVEQKNKFTKKAKLIL